MLHAFLLAADDFISILGTSRRSFGRLFLCLELWRIDVLGVVAGAAELKKRQAGATVSISLSRRPLPALFSRPGLCCWERAVLIYPEARSRFPPPGPLAAKPP